ncbi:hypothetical protein G6F43_013380 [Rhizopus delemar]|nr:hypothetical protein G6F43_013380 [Rhizopus delemar]
MSHNDTDELLRRLQHLETLLQQNSAVPVDPYLTARPAALDLQPYEDFYKILPDADNDFFRSPLSETARRSFLSHCPSNLDRNYRAPVVQRNVNAGTLTRPFDQQLADIQYRLSGITRPARAKDRSRRSLVPIKLRSA